MLHVNACNNTSSRKIYMNCFTYLTPTKPRVFFLGGLIRGNTVLLYIFHLSFIVFEYRTA